MKQCGGALADALLRLYAVLKCAHRPAALCFGAAAFFLVPFCPLFSLPHPLTSLLLPASANQCSNGRPSILAPPSSHSFTSCPSCRFFAANVQNIPVRGICMSGIIAVSFVLLGSAAFCIAFPQVTGSNAGWLSWCWFAYLPRTGIICALAPIFRQLESRKKIYLA